ncbi:MAG: VUT family protein [Deinococcales bacterium]
MVFFLAPLTALLIAHIAYHFFPKQAEMLIAMLIYITCTVLANYTFDSFLPFPGYGLINVGTLFFGITFTQRDRVHQYGRSKAYLMIFIAAIVNIIFAWWLGTPLRYIAVAFLAIVLSETADTEVYQRFIERRWLVRVASSNALSIPIDTIVFTLLAFYGEEWATRSALTEIIITDIIVKLIVGFIAALSLFGERKDQTLKPAL